MENKHIRGQRVGQGDQLAMLWGDGRDDGMMRCTVGGWRDVADVSKLRLSSKS